MIKKLNASNYLDVATSAVLLLLLVSFLIFQDVGRTVVANMFPLKAKQNYSFSTAPNTSNVKINLKDADYFELAFQLSVPNTPVEKSMIFQTEGGKGIRIELDHHQATVIAPQFTKVSGAPMTFFREVFQPLLPGHSYHVELKAQNKKYIKVHIWDEKLNLYEVINGPLVQLHEIQFATNADSQVLKDIKFTVGKTSQSTTMLNVICILIKASLLSMLIISFYRIIKSKRCIVDSVRLKSLHKFDPLLTLRAFACFMVLFGHGFMITFRSETIVDEVQKGAWLITSSPWAGVWVFFTLSGYLMGKGFFSGRYQINFDGVKSFFYNRALRILPIYWFSIIIVGLLTCPIIFKSENIHALFKLMMFYPYSEISIIPIGALWSVVTEVMFYLLVPVIFMIVAHASSKSPKLVSVVFIAIFIAEGLLYRAWLWSNWGVASWLAHSYKPIAGNIDLFLIGFFLNPLILALRKKDKTIQHGVMIGLITMLSLYLFASYVGAKGMILFLNDWVYFLMAILPTIVSVLAAMIIFFFELAAPLDKIKSPVMSAIIRYTQTLGILTYAMYVFHEPIHFAFQAHLPQHTTLLDTFIFFFSSLLVVMAVAYMAYHLIEAPFERMKKIGSHRKQVLEKLPA